MNKYYIYSEKYQHSNWQSLIITNEEEVKEKIELANLIYVPIKDINNIEEYRIVHPDSVDENMHINEAKNYMFMDYDDLTDKERDYIWNWELKNNEKNNIITNKMKTKGYYADDLETFLNYSYWDGSNLKEVILQHPFYDINWIDFTEEFDGMKELEYKDQDRGMYTLYELTDGGKILIFSSYYQGELWDICFIYNNSIDNIETAIEFANREEE